jgi:hypothetical protein
LSAPEFSNAVVDNGDAGEQPPQLGERQPAQEQVLERADRRQGDPAASQPRRRPIT